MGTTEQDLVKEIEELLNNEYEYTDQICRRGGIAGSGSGANKKDGCVKHELEGRPSENVPREFPNDKDPKLLNRDRRMFAVLRGTLEKSKEENDKLSSSEAHIRRLESMKRVEEKEHVPSEGLIGNEYTEAEMRQAMVLRAMYANRAEEKISELLLFQWSEHHKILDNFRRTKEEPPIYYSFAKPLEEENKDPTSLEESKKLAFQFQEWEAVKERESQRLELVKQQNVANVDIEFERWLTRRETRMGNDDTSNLQETPDKELETHRLEQGPKTQMIPGGDNIEDEDDVENIDSGVDDRWVMDVDDN